MIDGKCVKNCEHSKLKIEERGKSAVFRDGRNLTLVTVDGCLDINGPRADYVIESNRSAVVVELKGIDVEHGAIQVIETANLWINIEHRCDRISGLIVAKQYPRATSSIQIKQKQFSKRFRGPLHVVTKNLEFSFDGVMSFRGPLKV